MADLLEPREEYGNIITGAQLNQHQAEHALYANGLSAVLFGLGASQEQVAELLSLASLGESPRYVNELMEQLVAESNTPNFLVLDLEAHIRRQKIISAWVEGLKADTALLLLNYSAHQLDWPKRMLGDREDHVALSLLRAAASVHHQLQVVAEPCTHNADLLTSLRLVNKGTAPAWFDGVYRELFAAIRHDHDAMPYDLERALLPRMPELRAYLSHILVCTMRERMAHLKEVAYLGTLQTAPIWAFMFKMLRHLSAVGLQLQRQYDRVAETEIEGDQAVAAVVSGLPLQVAALVEYIDPSESLWQVMLHMELTGMSAKQELQHKAQVKVRQATDEELKVLQGRQLEVEVELEQVKARSQEVYEQYLRFKGRQDLAEEQTSLISGMLQRKGKELDEQFADLKREVDRGFSQVNDALVKEGLLLPSLGDTFHTPGKPTLAGPGGEGGHGPGTPPTKAKVPLSAAAAKVNVADSPSMRLEAAVKSRIGVVDLIGHFGGKGKYRATKAGNPSGAGQQ